MKKISKILVVVLSLALLCGVLTTMLSAAGSGVAFPNYSTPSAAVQKGFVDFENGTAWPTGTANTSSTVVQGTSKYDQYSFDQSTVESYAKDKDWLSLPSYYISNIFSYEYITIEYDITADKYTNGTSLITIEEYNALTDIEKEAYTPSYYESEFYWEFKGISGKSGTYRVIITKIDGNWYIADGSNKIKQVQLPTEAGVWTHVTQIVEIGNTVTYESNGGTKTCSFKEFTALLNSGAVTAENLISLNVSESAHHVYVNGEYAFTFDNWASTSSNNDTYANYLNGGLNDNQSGYGLKWGRWRNVATVSAPFSVGIDNQACYVYADGYNGDFADAVKNKTSLLDTNDAVFNKNYNKTNSVSATVTHNGTAYAYFTAAQAYKSINDGDTLELFADANVEYSPSVNVSYVKTNGHKFTLANGYALTDNGDGKYKCTRISSGYTVDGIYYSDISSAIAMLKNGSVLQVHSPVNSPIVTDKSITVYKNGYDFDVVHTPTSSYYAHLLLIDEKGNPMYESTLNDSASILNFFKSMKNGYTVKLLSNTINNSSILFSIPGEYSIDFNGYDYISASVDPFNSFTIHNGVTVNVKSSRPGTEIYNISAQNTGGAIFHLNKGTLSTKNSNLNIDGENIKTFSSAAVYSQSGEGTININGGSYYKTLLSSYEATIATRSAHVYNIEGATLISTLTRGVIYVMSSTAKINVNNSILYAPNYTIITGLNSHASKINFTNSVLASLIFDVGASASVLHTGVTIGHGCAFFKGFATSPLFAEGYVFAKTSERVGADFLTHTITVNEDGTVSYSGIGYEGYGVGFEFDTVILTSGYHTVTWKNGEETVVEIWKDGITPVCPFEIPEETDFYEYVPTVTSTDADGNVVYEILPSATFEMFMNLTLYTDFIYNLYIPKAIVDAGYIRAQYVNGTAVNFAEKTVSINGSVYYVIEISIIPSLADRVQTVSLNIVAPDGKSFTHTLQLSIPNYANTILEGNYSDTTFDLMNATLAYIKAAGDYFGTGSGVIGAVTNAQKVNGKAPLTPDESIRNVISGATLSLDSTFKITFYFSSTASGNVTFSYPVKGVMTDHTVTATPNGVYQVSFRAKELLSTITIKVGDKTTEYGIENYIYTVNSESFRALYPEMTDTQYENLKTLVYNLHAYAVASKSYVSESSQTDIVINDNLIDSYVIVAKNSAEEGMAAYIQNAIYNHIGVYLPIVSSSNGPAFRFSKLSLPSAFYDSAVYIDGDDVMISSYLASFMEKTAMKFATEFIPSLYGINEWDNGDFVAIYSANEVYYSDFGAVGDGVTNDSIALHNTHDYANTRGYLVRGDVGMTYYVDHNYNKVGGTSSIIIATDTDWTGAKFIVDDSNLYNGVSTGAFMRVDPAYNDIVLTDAMIEALFPGKTINKDTITKVASWDFGFPAMIFVTNANHYNYRRYEGGELSAGGVQKELIVVDEFGNIDESTPFLFSYDTITSVKVIRIDSDTLTLKGGEFTSIECMSEVIQNETTNRIYASRSITIMRSNTVLDGVKHYVIDNRTGEAKTKLASSGFFGIQEAANVLLKNCVATGHLRATAGSYDISISSSNNVVFQNVTQSNYFQDAAQTIPGVRNNVQWGVMGSNGNKNITYDSCLLTRFDAHTGLYNGKILNSRVASIELIGGGDFLIENTTIDEYSPGTVVMLRSDYGSTWNGTFTFKNVTINNVNTTSTLFSIMNQDLDFGYQRYVPNVILDNVKFTNTNIISRFHVFSKSLTSNAEPHNFAYPYIAPSYVTVLNNTNNHKYYVYTSNFYSNTTFTGVTQSKYV